MKSKGKLRHSRRRAVWPLVLATVGAFVLVGTTAAPAQADSNFERGFEDQMGRILAHEAVNLGKHVLFQGVFHPYRDHGNDQRYSRRNDRHRRKHYSRREDRHRGKHYTRHDRGRGPSHDHWKRYDADDWRHYRQERRHDRHERKRHRRSSRHDRQHRHDRDCGHRVSHHASY